MPTRRSVLGGIVAGTGTLAGCVERLADACPDCVEQLGDSCPDGDLGRVAGEWTTRGGGPGHAGATDAGGFASEPEVRWCAELEGRPNSLALSSGSLFAIERTGDLNDRSFFLTAIDAGDGAQRWRRSLPEKPIAELAIGAGGIHLAMETGDGDLVARYGLDGSEAWTVEFEKSTDSMVAVADGTVYVVDVAGGLHAYDAMSGSREWSRKVSNRVDPSLLGNVPAVADGTVYVGTAIGKGPAAVSAADGSVLWQRDLPDCFHPQTDGDVLVGRDEGVLYALDAASGETRWQLEGSIGKAAATIGHGAVYVFRGGNVVAYDAADGSRRWTFGPPASIGTAHTVVAADGAVLVAGSEGLVNVDPGSGQRRWSAEVGVGWFLVGDGVGFSWSSSDSLQGLAF